MPMDWRVLDPEGVFIAIGLRMALLRIVGLGVRLKEERRNMELLLWDGIVGRLGQVLRRQVRGYWIGYGPRQAL